MLPLYAFIFIIISGKLIEWWNGVNDPRLNYQKINKIHWYLTREGAYETPLDGLYIIVLWVFFPIYILYVLIKVVI